MAKREIEHNNDLITHELLLALLNQLYAIEVLLADVYNGKANLRYSNEMLERDSQVLESLVDLVKNNAKGE